MPLRWPKETGRELCTHRPSRPYRIRSTESSNKSSRMLGWWLETWPSIRMLFVWSWPLRSWGACCTGGQRLFEKWLGSYSMRCTTCETRREEWCGKKHSYWCPLTLGSCSYQPQYQMPLSSLNGSAESSTNHVMSCTLNTDQHLYNIIYVPMGLMASTSLLMSMENSGMINSWRP